MKVRTSELTGIALDWAVSQCKPFGEGKYWQSKEFLDNFKPSLNWAQGGTIINEQEITLDYRENETLARKWSDKLNNFIEARASKKQGLLAAMRCYVVSKLGDEIEIPEELLK